MKRFAFALALLVSADYVAHAPRAQAQEIEVTGPLAGAPAVIGLRVYREMRLQIQAHWTATLTDEFTRTMLAGGQLMFHPVDWLGVGVWGGFGVLNIDSTLTDEVTEKGQTNDLNVLSLPDAAEFPKQIGHIKWMASPQVAFIPLRGKLGVFESLFVDTDLYFMGGVAFVGLEERESVALSDCASPGATLTMKRQGCRSGLSRSSRSTLAPTFGVGLSMYFNDFLGLTLEWRGMPFAWNTSGTDESGAARGDYPDEVIDENDRLAHFNHMFTIGFAFFVPTEPGRSFSD
ncbi:MAG: hypothetical protein OXU20_38415 [Myxococcales bacterium]|nr:hypothetical protein [Myxococcales bacterium]MDD9971557.1 hypothetical protein [Myxococcales bacterium]